MRNRSKKEKGAPWFTLTRNRGNARNREPRLIEVDYAQGSTLYGCPGFVASHNGKLSIQVPRLGGIDEPGGAVWFSNRIIGTVVGQSANNSVRTTSRRGSNLFGMAVAWSLWSLMPGPLYRAVDTATRSIRNTLPVARRFGRRTDSDARAVWRPTAGGSTWQNDLTPKGGGQHPSPPAPSRQQGFVPYGSAAGAKAVTRVNSSRTGASERAGGAQTPLFATGSEPWGAESGDGTVSSIDPEK